MDSNKLDLLGWILPVAAAFLAIYGAIKSGSDSSYLFAASVVLLILIEKRRAKIITAALIRIVDEKGALRGLVGWTGGDIQVGVRAEPIYNVAVASATLWGKTPNVSFTFGYSQRGTASGEIFERAPSIHVAGKMARQWRSYSLDFSFEEATNAPALSVGEHREDGVYNHRIQFT
jgi:hypothetical protein